MAIQRKARVAPFSTKTPLVSPKDKGAKEAVGTSGVARPHIEWFNALERAVNESVEVTSAIPANSAAAGQAGTIAFDANFLYICVGASIWKRVGLNNF